jgi:flagellar hook-associated protein 1 FlgK
MASSSIFEIGLTGLNAAQAGLNTTGHNIANAATCRISSAERDHEHASSRSRPVRVSSARACAWTPCCARTASFSTTRVLQAQTQDSYLQAYQSQINQIDNLLADPNAVCRRTAIVLLGGPGCASNPSSVPSRQSLISQAQALQSRFAAFSSRLADIRTGLNRQIADTTSQINTTAARPRRHQRSNPDAPGQATQPPNDLLDKRDQLISDLNKLIKTSVVKDTNGSVSVFIGNGQTLVLGAQSFTLSAAPSSADPANYDISYSAKRHDHPAQLDFACRRLARGAPGFPQRDPGQRAEQPRPGGDRSGADLQRSTHFGQDLNGALGQNFFNVPAAQVTVNANNAGTAAITASNSAVGALTASDYRLSFNAGIWTLTRLTDNTQTTFAAFPQTIDGVTLNLASGAASNGDSFLIQPTRNGARDISVALSDPALVAAAAPIRTASAVANTGDASIAPGTVNIPPPPDANLQQTVTITFTSATTFDVNGTGTGNPAGVAYTSGANITYNGWTTQITGTPRAGDTFTIARNISGVADNRNALLLTALQTTNTVANGTAKLPERLQSGGEQRGQSRARDSRAKRCADRTGASRRPPLSNRCRASTSKRRPPI